MCSTVDIDMLAAVRLIWPEYTRWTTHGIWHYARMNTP